MSKFTLPKRVDATLATEGVNFEISDEFGTDWGTYKLIWADNESTRGKAIFERTAKRYYPQLKNKTMTEHEVKVRVLVENYLVDWSLPISITGGKKLPFSKEDALEFLSMPDVTWLVRELINRADDITNFGAVHDVDSVSVVPEKN